MRILPNRDGLSRNSCQGRRTNDRPHKNFRNYGLAYYPDDNQRSPKHTRTSRISPLMDLLQKGREFAWSEQCEEAIRRLIGLVTLEPIIIPPNTDQQFILYMDASQFATGAILYQADKEQKDARGNPLLRPLGFNSQTFNKTEQNYPIYDRELLGMMRGLRTWRHLLRNTTHPVLVITDHANLQYYR